MINILIPSGGKSEFFDNSYYPKTLYEINGKPMLELVSSNFKDLKNKNFVYVLLKEECDKFHTDDIVKIIAKKKCDIVVLEDTTKGAICSSLMAIEYINNDDELIICNNDQVIDNDVNTIIDYFRSNNADSGIICFDNVHPRWSYAKCDGDDVLEVAEKRPISNCAIAGFYYFKKGSDFIECAKNVIRKGNTYNGNYYISSTINEMILKNKVVKKYDLLNSHYHTLYSIDHIQNYLKEINNYESGRTN